MKDYLNACALEIKNLKMNEREIAIFKSFLEKKETTISKIKELDNKISKLPEYKDFLEKRKKLNDNIREVKAKIKEQTKVKNNFDKLNNEKSNLVSNFSKYRKIKNNEIKEETNLIKKKTLLNEKIGATKKYSDKLKALDDKLKYTKLDENKYDQKLNDLISEKEHLQNTYDTKTNYKKIRAEYNKRYNEIADGIKGDYERYAKRIVENGGIKQFVYQQAKDRLASNPEDLEKEITNYKGTGKENNIWAEAFPIKKEIQSYLKLYPDEKIEKINTGNDPKIENLTDKNTKEFIDYIKKYMNSKNAELFGENYIPDNFNLITYDIDQVHNDLTLFKKDLMESIDTGKFVDNLRLKDEQLNLLNKEGIVGKSQNLNRLKIDENDTDYKILDRLLNEWIEDTKANRGTLLNLSQLPFKNNEIAKDFYKKYSKGSVGMNYVSYLTERFPKRLTLLKNYGTFSSKGIENLTTPRNFNSSFTRNVLKNTLDLYVGNPQLTSENMRAALKVLNGLKTLAISTRNLVLPFSSLADNATTFTLEAYKNNGENFMKNYFKSLASIPSNYAKQVPVFLKDLKSIGESFDINEIKKSFKQTEFSLSNILNNLADYDSIRYQEYFDEIKTFDRLNKFNDMFAFSPMGRIDNNHRKAAWLEQIRHIKELDLNVDTPLSKRLSETGFSKDNIEDLKQLINSTSLKEGVINEVKNTSLRNKLYKLKYSTDQSAVPIEITPYPLFKIENAFMKNLLGFFWTFHTKSATQVFNAMFSDLGEKGIAQKTVNVLSKASLLMLNNFVPNLGLNALFTYAYTGENPFSSEHIDDLIASAFIGAVYRPVGIAYAMLNNNSYSVGSQVSNPLLQTAGNTIGIVKSSYSYLLGDAYEQEQALNTIIKKLMSSYIPFSASMKISNNIYQNS